MALRADDDRRLLAADGAPVQGGEVVRGDLERVEEVIEVLDVADRPQAAHRSADRLAQDRGLANAGVGQPQVSVFRLQTLEHEVHVAQPPDVLTDYEQPRVPREVGVEVAKQHLAPVDRGRLVPIGGRDHRHLERRLI